MKIPAVHVVDFETLPISGFRPEYPPKPVGVSIRLPGEKKSTYFRWGHPDGNNCSLADAKRRLQAIWKPTNHILCHNGKFDVDVAETHMGCKRLPSLNYHDTMFLLFLDDPHSMSLELKPAAERLLGLPPEEKDAIAEWAKKNKEYCLSKWDPGFQPNGKHYPFKPAAYIGFAPGALVDPYARGDTDRTLGIFKLLWKRIWDAGMGPAYQREQKVMTIFLDNEKTGIRVDMEGLRRDIPIYEKAMQAADAWLRKRLKTPNLNIDSDREFAEALAQNKIVRDEDWTWTKGSKNVAPQRSVSKVNLTPAMFQDEKVAQVFGYRNRLQTCLNMFMRPWLVQAEARNGWVSTNWNQVRGAEGGTRTGRPSTRDPNFLNLSKSWGQDDGYIHPAFLRALELPLVRRYMLADEFGLWLHRDYNGQELRILANVEEGPLMQAYIENPWLDVHSFVGDMIADKTGKRFVRKNVKIANFRIIYGGGDQATATGIGCSLAEAKELMDAHKAALPSIKGKGGINDQCKAIGKAGGAITTLGGRLYYVEPPSFSKKYNRPMTYEYKLLNYYCQGGAADATKEAMINYDSHPKRRGRFLVQVYDELNASSPQAKAEKARLAAAREEMAVLRDSMESVTRTFEMDVALLSEGKWGTSWGDQQKFEEGKSNYE